MSSRTVVGEISRTLTDCGTPGSPATENEKLGCYKKPLIHSSLHIRSLLTHKEMQKVAQLIITLTTTIIIIIATNNNSNVYYFIP